MITHIMDQLVGQYDESLLVYFSFDLKNPAQSKRDNSWFDYG